MRVFWALTEGAVAAVLLLAGGLAALQAGAIATGLPFTIVLLVVVAGLFKGLRAELPGVAIDDVPGLALFESEDDLRDRRSHPDATTRVPRRARTTEGRGDTPDHADPS